jgi:hypothetical protein
MLTVHMNISIKLLSGPLEVGYTTLPSGYEKPFVEALQKLGINLNVEPVLSIPSTFV